MRARCHRRIRIRAQSTSRDPLAWPSRARLSHALWQGRSVRAQLIIVFVVIDVIAGLLAGVVTIFQARTSTRVEIAASMELAQLLVSEAVVLMQQEVPAEKFLADLSSQLRLVRHVRIVVKDAAGAPLSLRRPVGGADGVRDERAPAWFAALIAPPIASRTVPVVVNGQPIGSVEIIGEPQATRSPRSGETPSRSAPPALMLNVAVIAMLYFLFGRVLGPLTGSRSGLADLEQPELQGAAAAPAGAGARGHRRPLQRARRSAGSGARREPAS